ncbi:MAG: hypothetical protein ISP88_09920 [Pseudomonadales bacterium]|nr:hypothetical protein [Pseudomonadales bacterium]MBL6816321.1 hypothetical protein [Pseudomonadales bacterium]
MSEETRTSEEDRATMDKFGITNSTRQVYFYKQHRYEKLADAVRYAERDNASTQKPK